MKKIESHPILGEIQNDHFNNSVTYHKYWNTPENKKYHELLRKKYLDRPYCMSDCPIGWSKEVFELLQKIDKELGIEFNTTTNGGMNFGGGLFDWFIKTPFETAFLCHLEFLIFHEFGNPKFSRKRYWPSSLWERIKQLPGRITSIPKHVYQDFKSGVNKTTVRYVNPILNRLLKKRVELSQVKEKYGSLTIYFSGPDCFSNWIDQEIHKTEVKLAIKGCYWPLKGFWNSYSGYWANTKHNPEVIVAKLRDDGCIDVTKSVYRQAIKEVLGDEEFEKFKLTVEEKILRPEPDSELAS